MSEGVPRKPAVPLVLSLRPHNATARKADLSLTVCGGDGDGHANHVNSGAARVLMPQEGRLEVWLRVVVCPNSTGDLDQALQSHFRVLIEVAVASEVSLTSGPDVWWVVGVVTGIPNQVTFFIPHRGTAAHGLS